MKQLSVLMWGLATGALAAGAPPHGASYRADPAQSRLEFEGSQAGAPLRAVFHRFSAAIDFRPDALGDSQLDVTIDTGSVDSKDADRDATIKGADVFDVAHWPSAHYQTSSITKSPAGFHAMGTLNLRGVTHEVPIDFTFAAAPGGARLEGSATLKRLDFGVGQGDWKSTEWIGDQVKIGFSLRLLPQP
jgi:polyisoprenoid-binding protein YceI